jgi:hypothetical protein
MRNWLPYFSDIILYEQPKSPPSPREPNLPANAVDQPMNQKMLDPRQVASAPTPQMQMDPRYQSPLTKSKEQTLDTDEQEPQEEEEFEDEGAETEESSDSTEVLGQMYRLKKIYATLLSTSKLLDQLSGDPNVDSVKDEILHSIDMFHLIVSNIDRFQGRIEEIIDAYNDVLRNSTNYLKSVVSNQKEEQL